MQRTDQVIVGIWQQFPLPMVSRLLGPTDLALSMGLSRADYEHDADHRAAIARTLAACHAHGKLACCNTYSMSDADSKMTLGFDCITFQSDAELFTSAGESLLAQLRERTGRKAS